MNWPKGGLGTRAPHSERPTVVAPVVYVASRCGVRASTDLLLGSRGSTYGKPDIHNRDRDYRADCDDDDTGPFVSGVADTEPFRDIEFDIIGH